MGEVFPPLAGKEGALASAGKKRTDLCCCRSQIFSQPFSRKGVGVMVDFASGVQVGHAQNQHIHEWSCCVGERRARELPQSNLRVASAEAGDLLFRVEQKGNGEFVTGYVDEGAMTVSNPCTSCLEQSEWFLPLPPLAGSSARTGLGSRSGTRAAALASSGTPSADHTFS